MSTLYQAFNQWANRPADECFTSLQAMHDACERYRAAARTATVRYRDLSVEPHEQSDDIALIGPNGTPAPLTHYAFGQVAARAGAPAGYLRTLPVPLAVQAVNYGLRQHDDDDWASVLFHSNVSLVTRCLTSDRYTRIWNGEITRRLMDVESAGTWRPAPETTSASGVPTRGLYAGDRDMWAFMVDNDRRVFEHAPGGGLSRGFIVWNSEVGDRSFGWCAFLYEWICGNHRIMGARVLAEYRVRHVGKANARAFRDMRVHMAQYADTAASVEEARISQAQRFMLGPGKPETVEKVLGLRLPSLSRAVAEKVYDLAETRTDRYGAPNTAWGYSGAMTEWSQRIPYAGDRAAMDRDAGKVLAVAF